MFRILTALALAAGISSAASAQETTAPDGTEAFGIEPYVGVLGGYHSFDRDSDFGTVPGRSRFDGAVISGIEGVNVPLGPVVIGAEGHVGKGFGDIDWDYGIAGRAGFRAGESGLIFASAGKHCVTGKGKNRIPR